MMATGFTVANEILRPLSPDFSRRRGSFTKQSHSLDDKDSFSSSLPLALAGKDLDILKEAESTSLMQSWQNGLKGLFLASYLDSMFSQYNNILC